MKKISKEFYVPDGFMDFLTGKYQWTLIKSNVNRCKYSDCKNKITITWEEPSEKYLVTMEEMSDAVFDWYSNSGVPANFNDYVSNKLKQKLFGKTE